jgi:hypothetical protein
VRIQPARPAAPLPRGEEQQQNAQDELQHADPGGGLARLAGAGAARDEQDDRPHDAQPDDPAEDEGGPVRVPARRAEHQHDADDRDRAEGDDDGERQDLSDRVAHSAERLMPL